VAGDWLMSPDPGRKYGGAMSNPAPKPNSDVTPLPNVAGQSPADNRNPLAVGTPLFWVMGIAAVALGAAAYSTTVRVGPASASLHIGK
jgi:hypothetical protein